MTTMNTEPSERHNTPDSKQEAPERIWVSHDRQLKWTDYAFDGGVEYVRASVAAVAGDAADVLKILAGRHHAEHHKQFPAESCPAWPCDILRAAASSSAPAEPPKFVTCECGHIRDLHYKQFGPCSGKGCSGCAKFVEAPAEPLQPTGEQEPPLEDLAGEAAALLEELNVINGDAVILRANQMAFALRAGIKSSRQKLDLARADGYNDGFRQGRQSRAPMPPTTPSDAAMRAAEEIVKLTHSQDIDGGTKRITTAVAAIITRHLSTAVSDEELQQLSKLSMDDSRNSRRIHAPAAADNEGDCVDSLRTSIHRKDCGMPDCFICYGSRR